MKPPCLRYYLSWVPDPRAKRGRWYSLENLLAVCACAMIAGATTVEAVCEWARNAPSPVRAALRLRRYPLGWRQVPSRRCLSGLLARIDTDTLDRAVCSWLAARRSTRQNTEGTEDRLRAVAVDGKTVRGSKDSGGHQVHLLSAVDHDQAVTLAQREVDRKTNETGEFRPLLAWLDEEGDPRDGLRGDQPASTSSDCGRHRRSRPRAVVDRESRSPRQGHHLRRRRLPAAHRCRAPGHGHLPKARDRRATPGRCHQPRQSHPDQPLRTRSFIGIPA